MFQTEKLLQETVWSCKKARSYINFAKKHLTTTSLEILATYKKRERMIDLLNTLRTLKSMKSTDQQITAVLSSGNYSSAISILLENKSKIQSEEFMAYMCIESLHRKLNDTLLMTELQLDNLLSEVT